MGRSTFEVLVIRESKTKTESSTSEKKESKKEAEKSWIKFFCQERVDTLRVEESLMGLVGKKD